MAKPKYIKHLHKLANQLEMELVAALGQQAGFYENAVEPRRLGEKQKHLSMPVDIGDGTEDVPIPVDHWALFTEVQYDIMRHVHAVILRIEEHHEMLKQTGA